MRTFQRGFIDMAIASLGSAILGGLFSKKGQDTANETNIELANTAMQRRVEDLRKAGLNPMLAYSQGGAQSPQITNAVGAGVSSALQGGQLAEGIGGMAQKFASADIAKSQKRLIDSQAMVNEATAASQIAEAQARARERGSLADTASARAWVDEGVKSWDAKGRMAKGDTEELDARAAERLFENRLGKFRAEESSAKSISEQERYRIPEAKASADFWEKMKSSPRYLQMFMQLLKDGQGLRR